MVTLCFPFGPVGMRLRAPIQITQNRPPPRHPPRYRSSAGERGASSSCIYTETHTQHTHIDTETDTDTHDILPMAVPSLHYPDGSLHIPMTPDGRPFPILSRWDPDGSLHIPMTPYSRPFPILSRWIPMASYISR
jgi:hypothetical protein